MLESLAGVQEPPSRGAGISEQGCRNHQAGVQELPSRGAGITGQGFRNHQAGVQESPSRGAGPLRRASQSCRESAPRCKAAVNVKTEAIRSAGECRESSTRDVSCGWGAERTHCCGKRGWVAPQKNLDRKMQHFLFRACA